MKLTELKKVSPEDFIAGLQKGGEVAAKQVLSEARQAGLNVEAYMELTVDPKLSTNPAVQAQKDGVATVFQMLNAPISLKGSPNASLLLAAASNSFTTNKGLAVLVQPLIENLLREGGVKPPVDDVTKYIAQSRQVTQTEVITRGEWSGSSEDSFRSFRISEGANIPKRSIKATENTTKFYKHGSGTEVTYETLRQIGLQGLVPFMARQKQEQLTGRAESALSALLNGDAVYDAAPTANFSAYNNATLVSNFEESGLKPLLKMMHERYKQGRQFDTIVCSFDVAFKFALLFPINKGSTSIIAQGIAGAAPAGMLNVRMPLGMQFSFEIVASPNMPENKLLLLDRSATLEELVQTGSEISEEETTVGNQVISFYQTLSSGYKFIIDESRLLVDLSA